jgi:hypothetical protein
MWMWIQQFVWEYGLICAHRKISIREIIAMALSSAVGRLLFQGLRNPLARAFAADAAPSHGVVSQVIGPVVDVRWTFY